jgi:hypothetical protein
MSYFGKQYGHLFGFTSTSLLDQVEIVLTDKYLLCVKQRSILKQRPWDKNCTFREFSEELEENKTEKLIMLCLGESNNFMHLIEVDQACNINI